MPLTMTIFPKLNEKVLIRWIETYCELHDVSHCRPKVFAESDWETDIDIFADQNSWVRVEWPPLFGINTVPASEYFSRALDSVVVSSEFLDDHGWTYVILDRGVIKDKFVNSRFRYNLTEEEAKDYVGNAEILAKHFNIPTQNIIPYLRHIESYGIWDELKVLLGLKMRPKPIGKVFLDDRYQLDDERVFFDFWRRLGFNLSYDGAPAGTARIKIKKGFHDKFPKNQISF